MRSAMNTADRARSKGLIEMNITHDHQLLAQIRDYDICFAEFLKPSDNGQEIMQEILLREAFSRFAQQGIAIQQNAPTAILDFSCGPGDYSVAWTSDIARFLPKGMIFYCTDYPRGTSRATGEKFTTATVNKIEAAAHRRQLLLAQPPVAIDADLFSGEDLLMPAGKSADIVHWSHSGYHVRDEVDMEEQREPSVCVRADLVGWDTRRLVQLQLVVQASETTTSRMSAE